MSCFVIFGLDNVDKANYGIDVSDSTHASVIYEFFGKCRTDDLLLLVDAVFFVEVLRLV